MSDALAALKDRCDAYHLASKSVHLSLDSPTKQDSKIDVEGLVVSFPEERDTKNIIILDDDEITEVQASQFEACRFLKGYEGIWSEDLRLIECEIVADDPLRISTVPVKQLARLLGYDLSSDSPVAIDLPSPIPEVSIRIGEGSKEFQVLTSLKRTPFIAQFGRLSVRQTIRIEGFQVDTHNSALGVLLKIANSMLFQIDLATNIPFHLAIDRDIMRGLRIARRRTRSGRPELSSPQYEYDNEAMSLYWYARSAHNMPLLQFLAFYQVLEFYFPVYSRVDAQQRVRAILKDPTFSANNDTDLSKLLNAVQASAKGRTFGDERSQLRATISACIDNEALRTFLASNQDLRDFFDVQKKTKSLAKQKVSIASMDVDLRIEVAARIYELRCRIVHTKDDQEVELLLPFSPESSLLRYDLELLEFLARQVLIFSSRPLQLIL